MVGTQRLKLLEHVRGLTKMVSMSMTRMENVLNWVVNLDTTNKIIYVLSDVIFQVKCLVVRHRLIVS